MKRTLTGIVVAVGALAAAGIAWSSGVLGGGPAQIRIYGGGQIEAISRTVSVETNANQTDSALGDRSASPPLAGSEAT